MRRPALDAATEIAEQPAAAAVAASSSSTKVDDAVGLLHPIPARPPPGAKVPGRPGDHRRSRHADRSRPRRDQEVRASGDHCVARETGAVDDADPRHLPRQTRPQRERLDVECADERMSVSLPTAPALGEEHHQQLGALDDVEHPITLPVTAHALGSGETV